MKYAIWAKLVISTPAQQDNLHAGILSLIKTGTTWGGIVVEKTLSGTGEKGHLTDVRFHNKVDADNLFDHIKTRMDLIPVLSGRVTKHLCYHDEYDQPCEIIEDFVK